MCGMPEMIAIPAKERTIPAVRYQPNFSLYISQASKAAKGTVICIAIAAAPASICCTPIIASPKCSVHKVDEIKINGKIMPRGDLVNQRSTADAIASRIPNRKYGGSS